LRQKKVEGLIPSYREWPFYWLTRAYVRYIDALTSALVGTGLDASSWRVVMILRERDWVSVSDIASEANAKLSTMTKVVKRMKAEGLVAAREGSADRRVTEVSLTEAGLGLADVALDAARHVRTRAFGHMDRDRMQTLSDLLGEVAENLR
jgi:DNA-binding MarR family transcriptional regulator